MKKQATAILIFLFASIPVLAQKVSVEEIRTDFMEKVVETSNIELGELQFALDQSEALWKVFTGTVDGSFCYEGEGVLRCPREFPFPINDVIAIIWASFDDLKKDNGFIRHSAIVNYFRENIVEFLRHILAARAEWIIFQSHSNNMSWEQRENEAKWAGGMRNMGTYLYLLGKHAEASGRYSTAVGKFKENMLLALADAKKIREFADITRKDVPRLQNSVPPDSPPLPAPEPKTTEQ